MSLAAKVPHFHYVDEINCNALVELKTAFQRINPYPDVKHTFLPILVKSLSMALTKYPSLNSCFKEDSMEVIFKGSDNIEVAMATPNGLVVPNIKNVQSLSILQDQNQLQGQTLGEPIAGEAAGSAPVPAPFMAQPSAPAQTPFRPPSQLSRMDQPDSNAAAHTFRPKQPIV
ncbi:hypothetical protein AAHE18_01G207200 [Arachis hypogaea]